VQKILANKLLKKVVFFVTGNIHKFNEARLTLKEFDLSTAMLNVETIEIQADKIEDVAISSAMDAVKKCRLPIIVEDAGLFIKELAGFPGPYSSYVSRTIGTGGILRLMSNLNKRDAFFESVVAFCSPDWKQPKCFNGKIEGKITREMRGFQGFGFDPIFRPVKSENKTLAEMSIVEKNEHSHRADALRHFVDWYVSEL
jgi:XTP/dITP diphosphohydrolase